MTKTKSDAEIANRKLARAAKERQRRALKPGYTPRTDSKAAQLREMGVSADAHYARQRRKRIRTQDLDPAGDGSSCPTNGVSRPVEIEPAPALARVSDDGVSCQSDGDPWPGDGVSCPPPEPAPADDHQVKLYSDLWSGWVPVPPIRTHTSAEPSIDVSPGRADRLIAAVAHLPGGSDPAYQNTLRRLVEASKAHGAGR